MPETIDRWWAELSESERNELRRGASRRPPKMFVRYAEIGDADEPAADFYDYLVNHEVYIDDGVRFHICTAHPIARAAVAARRVPADFVCPRADARCPMRALLDRCPGREVRFVPEEER